MNEEERIEAPAVYHGYVIRSAPPGELPWKYIPLGAMADDAAFAEAVALYPRTGDEVAAVMVRVQYARTEQYIYRGLTDVPPAMSAAYQILIDSQLHLLSLHMATRNGAEIMAQLRDTGYFSKGG